MNAGAFGCALGRCDDALKIRNRQAFFEDEREREIERFRATHREVVDSAVDGEFADVAARKKDRRDHV